MGDEIWHDKSGKRISMSKMTKSHLGNALKHFLQRRGTLRGADYKYDFIVKEKIDVEKRVKMLKREVIKRNLNLDELLKKS